MQSLNEGGWPDQHPVLHSKSVDAKADADATLTVFRNEQLRWPAQETSAYIGIPFSWGYRAYQQHATGFPPGCLLCTPHHTGFPDECAQSIAAADY